MIQLGWILVGALVGGIARAFLVTFWDNIKVWLNNVAANFVENAFGYGASQKMKRAVVKIDRVMDKIRNRTNIYLKENKLDTHYIKAEIEAESDVNDIDDEILSEIREKKVLTQEYEYKI